VRQSTPTCHEPASSAKKITSSDAIADFADRERPRHLEAARKVAMPPSGQARAQSAAHR
jgi:hypothetical protein